jgi:hypothetical protein
MKRTSWLALGFCAAFLLAVSGYGCGSDSKPRDAGARDTSGSGGSSATGGSTGTGGSGTGGSTGTGGRGTGGGTGTGGSSGGAGGRDGGFNIPDGGFNIPDGALADAISACPANVMTGTTCAGPGLCQSATMVCLCFGNPPTYTCGAR